MVLYEIIEELNTWLKENHPKFTVFLRGKEVCFAADNVITGVILTDYCDTDTIIETVGRWINKLK